MVKNNFLNVCAHAQFFRNEFPNEILLQIAEYVGNISPHPLAKCFYREYGKYEHQKSFVNSFMNVDEYDNIYNLAGKNEEEIDNIIKNIVKKHKYSFYFNQDEIVISVPDILPVGFLMKKPTRHHGTSKKVIARSWTEAPFFFSRAPLYVSTPGDVLY